MATKIKLNGEELRGMLLDGMRYVVTTFFFIIHPSSFIILMFMCFVDRVASPE
jgi:hypothetical protein